jgi:hypothetical protein
MSKAKISLRQLVSARAAKAVLFDELWDRLKPVSYSKLCDTIKRMERSFEIETLREGDSIRGPIVVVYPRFNEVEANFAKALFLQAKVKVLQETIASQEELLAEDRRLSQRLMDEAQKAAREALESARDGLKRSKEEWEEEEERESVQ